MKKIVNPLTGEETIVCETVDGLVRPKAGMEANGKSRSKLQLKSGSGLRSGSKSQSKPRDINEDDDGYHPYSDRMPDEPLFEENPWR